MHLRALSLVFLALTSLLHAQRYDPELLGRWKVEFQIPPEKEIVEAQLQSLNLGYLMGRIDMPTLDPLIITISRNKFLIQSDGQFLEAYNCVLEDNSIVILDRQQKLSPIPREYFYKLEGNELVLTGSLNKINNLPVTLKLRRVMAIPEYGDGSRGWMSRQGFLDVGTLSQFANNQVIIERRENKPIKLHVGQLMPLDQLSLHEPELVRPDRIQPTFEEEKQRFLGLPYPIIETTEEAISPVFFTKEYFFDEDKMDEGYLLTLYNTDEGLIKFRAHGSGGGTSRGALNIRYMKDRKDNDRMIVWINDEEIFERPLEEVQREQAKAAKDAAKSEAADKDKSVNKADAGTGDAAAEMM
ncbi:hypothetical protein [Cerasicoccus fimbriatus]|uniref:hypothetical protein n=1 Tax=Cerasicoccus fimbriatus TaxID=3014554 RepID=UPI0022B2C1E3|nr:hypothetical protein [Cerasicoccus sp. TK19100]